MADAVRDITIAFAEPDRDLLRLMRGLLIADGYRVFGLNHLDPADIVACRADCIVLTLDRFPVDALLRDLFRHAPESPIIAIAASDQIDLVELVKSGVTDFLRKPYQTEELVARIAKATGRFGEASERSAGTIGTFTVLTGREHEVLAELASGASSKEAGRKLGISPRTVDVHRARIKEKLHVRRSVDLVRLVFDVRKT